jgi:hypothetical protein
MFYFSLNVKFGFILSVAPSPLAWCPDLTGEHVESNDTPGLTIEVLGPGCFACESLMEELRDVLAKSGIDANLEHVRDPTRIIGYGLIATPALVGNGTVRCAGRRPTSKETEELITCAANLTLGKWDCRSGQRLAWEIPSGTADIRCLDDWSLEYVVGAWAADHIFRHFLGTRLATPFTNNKIWESMWYQNLTDCIVIVLPKVIKRWAVDRNTARVCRNETFCVDML